MKNLITPEEVSRRATSPESALEVSDEVWGQRCEMNEEELKEVRVSPQTCGLCVYYGIDRSGGFCNRRDHGICILWDDDVENHCCCQECKEADSLLWKHKQGNATFSELKSAIYAMKARLEREKAKLPKESKKEEKKEAKPEIRHGDYGLLGLKTNSTDYYCYGPYLVARPDQQTDLMYISNFCITPTKCKPGEDNYKFLKIGNLFDELKGMDAEMKKYVSKSRFGTSYRASLDTMDDNVCVLSEGAALSLPEARRFARAILVLCANAERGK